MPKYYFPNGTPTLLKVEFGLMFANILCVVGSSWWVEVSAPRRPTGSWTYPLNVKGGTVYLPHLPERYITLGFLTHFVLLGGFLLMLWRYHSKGLAVRLRWRPVFA